VDINGGLHDSRNLKADGSMDIEDAFDTILEIVVGSNITPQNQLVK